MSHAQVRDPVGVPAHGSPSSFWQRVLGAVRLEPDTWQEILEDGAGGGQAAVVVAGASAASATADFLGFSGTPITALLSFLSTFSTWLLLSLLLWGLANWFRHRLHVGASFRIVGFSIAPLTLVVLAAIPAAPVQLVVRLLAFSLFFAALVGGTRQALRVETTRAVFVCAMTGLVGIFVTMLLLFLAASL